MDTRKCGVCVCVCVRAGGRIQGFDLPRFVGDGHARGLCALVGRCRHEDYLSGGHGELLCLRARGCIVAMAASASATAGSGACVVQYFGAGGGDSDAAVFSARLAVVISPLCGRGQLLACLTRVYHFIRL